MEQDNVKGARGCCDVPQVSIPRTCLDVDSTEYKPLIAWLFGTVGNGTHIKRPNHFSCML